MYLDSTSLGFVGGLLFGLLPGLFLGIWLGMVIVARLHGSGKPPS